MTVLLAAPTARGNPVQSLLYASLPASGIEVRNRHGWPRDHDLEGVDVLHLGWPDRATQRTGPVGTCERRLARSLASIATAKARGTRVIFTLHNAAPRRARHGDAVARFTRSLLRGADTVHVFDDRHIGVAHDLAGTTRLDVRVVPHPLYPVQAERHPRPSRVSDERRPIRVAALGWLRQDKQINQLARVAGQVARTEGIPVKLIVGGSPHLSVTGITETLRLLGRAAAVTELSVRPWRHTDAGFERLMASCDVAVAGNPEALNSGTVFLALSLGLRIVAPALTLPPSLLSHPLVKGYRSDDELPRALSEQVRAAKHDGPQSDYRPLLAGHRPEEVGAQFRDLVVNR